MSNVLNLHVILQKPYPAIMKETEQLLLEFHDKVGEKKQYKAETIRFALKLTNKFLKEELKKDSNVA